MFIPQSRLNPTIPKCLWNISQMQLNKEYAADFFISHFKFATFRQPLFPAISPNRQILWILKVAYLVTEPTIFRPSGCNSTLHLRSSQQCSIAAALWNEPITLLEITVFTQVINDRWELLKRTLKFVGAHVKNADEISRLSKPPPSSIMCQPGIYSNDWFCKTCRQISVCPLTRLNLPNSATDYHNLFNDNRFSCRCLILRSSFLRLWT